MYLARALTLGAVGVSLVVGLFVVPAGAAQAATPAQAATLGGVAYVGSANVTIAGYLNTLGAIAKCRVDSTADNSTSGSSIAGVVSFGPGRSSCTRSHGTGTTTSTAIGTRFQLDALMSLGGPRIRLADFRVTCRADRFGARVDSSFNGVTGLGDLPRIIPENYTLSINDRGGRQIATAILNEVKPARFHRGGVALNLLHILWCPDGGPLGGDVIVGRTACARTY
jgi:hypothetical protein